jgi:hypothetical protein
MVMREPSEPVADSDVEDRGGKAADPEHEEDDVEHGSLRERAGPICASNPVDSMAISGSRRKAGVKFSGLGADVIERVPDPDD